MEEAVMADAIVGTAGILFTLAIIAVGAFIVGMGLYGIADHLRASRRRGHSRHHHSQATRYTTATVAVGHAIVASTDHRAAALLATFAKSESEGGSTHWLCRAELAFALLCSVRGYYASNAPRQQVEALGNLLYDVVAGDLRRCRPDDVDKHVTDLQDKRLHEFEESADNLSNLYEPPYGVYRITAFRIAEWLGIEDPDQKQSLLRNISDMLKSAVSIEISTAMK